MEDSRLFQGSGIVLRDDHGRFKWAKALRSDRGSNQDIKLQTIKDSIIFCKDNNFDQLDIEIESKYLASILSF